MRIASPLPRDAAQLGDPADVDDGGRRRQTQLQQRQQAVAAGQQLRAGMRGEQLLRVGDRAGAVVVEGRCIHGLRALPGFALHRAPDALGRQRHLDRLDAERLQRVDHGVVDRAVDAIVPASPMPLTPSGWCGDGVTVDSTSMSGSTSARGMA